MLFVGMLAAVTLANQFGFDGSAYAANVVAGVSGRVELRARMTAFSLYVLPMLAVVAWSSVGADRSRRGGSGSRSAAWSPRTVPGWR